MSFTSWLDTLEQKLKGDLTEAERVDTLRWHNLVQNLHTEVQAIHAKFDRMFGLVGARQGEGITTLRETASEAAPQPQAATPLEHAAVGAIPAETTSAST